jgi:uncharacterized protein (DUF1697 family)
VTQYVAFLRAVNVAGHARVPMSDVKQVFVAAGCGGVRTYIQSVNVLFQVSPAARAGVMQRVRTKLRDLLGEEPGLVLRSVPELAGILENAPFKRLAGKPRVKLYVAFLFQKPSKNPRFPVRSSKEALEAVGMRDREVFVVSHPKPNGFYGFPNNFVEQELGVAATSRNWSTITTIVALVRGNHG